MEENVKAGLLAVVIVVGLLVLLDCWIEEKERRRSREAVKDEVRGR